MSITTRSSAAWISAAVVGAVLVSLTACGGSRPVPRPTLPAKASADASSGIPQAGGTVPIPIPLTIDPVGTLRDAGDTIYAYARSSILETPGGTLAAGYQALAATTGSGVSQATATANAVSQILGYADSTRRQWELQRADAGWWSLSVPGVEALACLRATPPTGTEDTVIAVEHSGEVGPESCADLIGALDPRT